MSRSRGRRLADEQGPGHVAAVARDLGAEVEQDDAAGLQPSVTGRPVRQGGLGPAEAGDVEGQSVGTAGPHQPLETHGELGLGAVRPDLREQRGERPVCDRTRRRDALQLGRLLDRSIRLDPAFDRHELDIGRRRREAVPGRVRDEPRLDRDPASTDRRGEVRPSLRQVAVGLDEPCLGRLAAGLDRVARIGQHDDLVPTDQELARRAGNLLLAVAEREPGQVAHVLGSNAEVGVDPGFLEPRPQAAETGRAGGAVGLDPVGPSSRVRWRGEVLGAGPPDAARGHV